ncbi:MAG: hypothetical protein JWN94_4888 [Betaproteobacteria bacterium]|nr:hypothetical protein [Betaproteobacteria bacterium]
MARPQTDMARQTHAECSGCSLCLLVCPVWRRTRDLQMTPHGRNKALQHGATLADIAPSVESCTLCGACEPVCPENIDLVDMLMKLRRDLPPSTVAMNLHAQMQARGPLPVFGRTPTDTVLLATVTHKWNPSTLALIRQWLGGDGHISIEHDGGADIALALEIGADIPPARLERFLAPLRLRRKIIVSDGLLIRSLRAWLPQAQLVSLGVALSSIDALRAGLGAGDLYVIESRAYHCDHAALVNYYDELRAQTGCTLNLDLQRIAIPVSGTGMRRSIGTEPRTDEAQVEWLLKGRQISRIVIESELDRRTLELCCAIPVVHLAEIAARPAATSWTAS